MTAQSLSALHHAERVLSLIVGECPDVEPVYPAEGSPRRAHDDWGFDSAHWNTAELARPALEAVRAELRTTCPQDIS